jgi:hypothetical protein
MIYKAADGDWAGEVAFIQDKQGVISSKIFIMVALE